MSEQNPLVDYFVAQKYLDPNEVKTAEWAPQEAEMKTRGYDRWARMAPEIMSEPVISAKYMADRLGMPEELAGQVFGDRISMSDFVSAMTRLTEIKALENRLRENGFPEEKIPAMLQAQAEHFGPQWDAQAEATKQALITGKGTSSQIGMARYALGAVAAHTPKGPYTQYAGRTQEEAKQATAQYGMSADFALTPAGQQNYAAQRVMEFFDAPRQDYEPATGWGQFTRIVGGLASPWQRGIQETFMGGAKDVVDEKGNNVYLDPFKDAGRIATPGGKFDFASDLAERSRGATNVYDKQGRANFLMNSALTPTGMGNAYLNSSYPIGYGVNALFGNKQLGDFAGIAMGEGLGTAVDDANAARAIRTQGNRVTPRTIPGLTGEQMQAAQREMEKNDTASDSYVSAALARPLSDATFQKRSFLSPVASGAFNILGELGSDPINVGYNIVAPGLGAATTMARNISSSGGKTLIPHLKQGIADFGKGIGKSVANVTGDVVDEGLVEPVVFGAPTVGMGIFSAQEDNALMDTFGGGKKPDEEGFDPAQANIERVVHRRQTTQPVIDAQKRTRTKAEPMDYQRPPTGGRVMY